MATLALNPTQFCVKSTQILGRIVDINEGSSINMGRLLSAYAIDVKEYRLLLFGSSGRKQEQEFLSIR